MFVKGILICTNKKNRNLKWYLLFNRNISYPKLCLNVSFIVFPRTVYELYRQFIRETHRYTDLHFHAWFTSAQLSHANTMHCCRTYKSRRSAKITSSVFLNASTEKKNNHMKWLYICIHIYVCVYIAARHDPMHNVFSIQIISTRKTATKFRLKFLAL